VVSDFGSDGGRLVAIVAATAQYSSLAPRWTGFCDGATSSDRIVVASAASERPLRVRPLSTALWVDSRRRSETSYSPCRSSDWH